MKFYKVFSAALLCAALALCGSGAYAMRSVSVVNHIESGFVNIQLNEFMLDENGTDEVPYVQETEQHVKLLPGADVSKIPRITNRGADCYVRAKVDFENIDDLSLDNVYGITEDWVLKEDGYLYYTKVLETDENVDIFEGFSVPDDFSQDNELKQFNIPIHVDAIQELNFIPDFAASNPWGEVVIVSFDKGDNHDINTLQQGSEQKFIINYLGESKDFIKNADDFFTTFDYLMPGDVYSDTADIRNDSDEKIRLYFQSEVYEDSELLEEVYIKIDCTIDGNTETIYDGPLSGSYIKQRLLLGEVPAGSKAYFEYSLRMPEHLNNDYTLLAGDVKWIFSTEVVDVPYTVQTGDPMGGVLIIAGLILAMYAVTYYKSKKEQESYE